MSRPPYSPSIPVLLTLIISLLYEALALSFRDAFRSRHSPPAFLLPTPQPTTPLRRLGSSHSRLFARQRDPKYESRIFEHPVPYFDPKKYDERVNIRLPMGPRQYNQTWLDESRPSLVGEGDFVDFHGRQKYMQGRPQDPPEYQHPFSVHNFQRYHAFNPWWKGWDISDGEYPIPEREFGWGEDGVEPSGSRQPLLESSPQRPPRESDYLFPTIPWGWRKFLVVALDKPGFEWYNYGRHPQMVDHIVWARLSLRLRNATAKVLWDMTIYNETSRHGCGNLINIAAPTLKHAKEFAEKNPYFSSGLYRHHEIFEWHDIADEHLMMGAWKGEDTFLVFGKDSDLTAAKIREQLEEKHHRYLCRCANVVHSGSLKPPRQDSQEELDRPVKQIVPLIWQLKGPNPVGAMPNNETPVGEMSIITCDSLEQAKDYARRDPFTRAGLYKNLFVAQVVHLDITGRHRTLEHTPRDMWARRLDFDYADQIIRAMGVTENNIYDVDEDQYQEYLKDWHQIKLPFGNYMASPKPYRGDTFAGRQMFAWPYKYDRALNMKEGLLGNNWIYRDDIWVLKNKTHILWHDNSTGEMIVCCGDRYSWDKPVDEMDRTQILINYEILMEELRKGRYTDYLHRDFPPMKHYAGRWQSMMTTMEEKDMMWGLPSLDWDNTGRHLKNGDFVPPGMEFMSDLHMGYKSEAYQEWAKDLGPDGLHDVHTDFWKRVDRGEADPSENPFLSRNDPSVHRWAVDKQQRWQKVPRTPTHLIPKLTAGLWEEYPGQYHDFWSAKEERELAQQQQMETMKELGLG
ncbi:unnamed protein product [Vitrella brassicaformis CCMP3155]|uniref:YCII-related domain-containing protein n=2 Tax=Vitrella brassicaformis TaxID=1169539 RepID=A0A0G4FUX5_VITBC|nr:unnamed protein product [Vitrella brassicaformis CCMP3155]|eukprot:CEM18694.1 unnamed protein product [Vitrella brassicaformis CCMP3155]